jgi:hypothetical protein
MTRKRRPLIQINNYVCCPGDVQTTMKKGEKESEKLLPSIKIVSISPGKVVQIPQGQTVMLEVHVSYRKMGNMTLQAQLIDDDTAAHEDLEDPNIKDENPPVPNKGWFVFPLTKSGKTYTLEAHVLTPAAGPAPATIHKTATDAIQTQ